MKEELRKSLTDLIDETLMELEELKKSRYSAVETDLKGPGEGIAGKPSNGDLNAKKAEDDKEDDEDEDKKEEAAKAEGSNREADPNGGNHKMDKAEDKKSDEEPHKDDPEHEKKEKEMAKKLLDMHKAQEEFPTLMKSFVEERVKPLEDKLSMILDVVNKIAEMPVQPKGTTARAVPLLKSTDEYAGGEPLSKAEVATKLLELKKSGAKVDTLDIARAEMGHDLVKIVEKYQIS